LLNLFNPFKGELSANQVVSDVNLGNHTLTAGGTTSGQSIIASGLVVNQDGGNLATDDFRVETVSNANALVVDASADQITSNIAHLFPLMTEGSVLFVGAGGILSQDNSDLFWDDTNKRLGIGTATPATPLEVDGFVRTTNADYRRYYHLALAAFDPGASGATWIDPTANTLGGWQLDAAGEVLFAKVDIHADWDGASDINLELYFECNTDNTGGLVGDTVDINVVFYYKAIGGEITARTQTVMVANVVGQSDQGVLFKCEIPINWDEVDNVIMAGDQVTCCMNLATATSDVDDIIITGASFYYHTKHIGIESGDT